MLGISTVWNYNTDLDMFMWLISVKDLGLNAIEIDYKVTREQINVIDSLRRDLGIKVLSVHNFCPTPDNGESTRHPSNFYRLTSLDEKERLLAVKWTKNTIDTAAKVDAATVVVHAGTIDFEDGRCHNLFSLHKHGAAQVQAYDDELARILRVRQEIKGPYIEAAIKSFKDVVSYAEDKGIKIGLETRFYPIEIPNFEEIGQFLNMFGTQGMGYWHDVGHAEINERLGITDHIELLNTYKDRMIGMHVHGVEIMRDHIAPFAGDMDFDKILPFMKKDIPYIIESKYATFEKIRSSIFKLKALI
ncbi:MAG: sugar phosphate isomerase/epimerase [Candidatus Omnitrophica bacterium]|nr:sugar phosphate isomerase/epimerase [Candidatus Omnitrophota bacterium]MBU1996108.1 sugar phosphate isomerase/epimerase [Candidatus Omnitrophota bacterium]MBU4334175.1 sugar phosphate isomerase/epimerase [Candidatus Omnitrophota bacterium]